MNLHTVFSRAKKTVMGLLFHKANRIPKEEKCLTISDCKISFSHGQNPVLKIINDNETFFFKQFGKPVSRKSFIVEQTYYFCKIIEKSDDYTGDEKQYFKLFLTEFLTKKSINKIYNSIFDEMATAVVLKDVFNLNDTDKNYRLCREYIIYLKKVFFISLGKIYSLKNKYDLSFYYRAKSVFELSKSFNIDNLIEEPFVMKIIFENSSKYLLGIATRLCQGKIGEEAGVGITPEIYRDLTNLNYLDFLCVQKDHWPHNLVVFSRQENIYHIKAFDNDAPKVMSCKFRTKRYKRGEFSSVVENKTLNRPIIDKDFYDNVFLLKNKDFIFLRRYLTFLQYKAFVFRFNLLKNALKAGVKNNKIKILNLKDWKQPDLFDKYDGSRKWGITLALSFYWQSKNKKV